MLGLIDGDVLLHSSLWQSKDFQHFKNKLELTLEEWYLRSFCEDYIIALGGDYNYRDDIYSLYKKSPSRENNRKGRVEHYHEAREYLKSLSEAVVTDEEEADDLIGHWVAELSNKSLPYTIISIDKDLNQLPGWHYNPDPRFERVYTVNEDQAKDFFLKQMIIGDSIDNIPGIAGLGPIKAKEIINKTEIPLYQLVIELYKYKYKDDWESHFLTNGKLLWIQRYKKDYFNLARFEEVFHD
jgi:DNA polymerase-1